MTPIYTNSSSSPFPFELKNEDCDQNHPLLGPNYYQAASSSSHSSCQNFFNSTTQDQTKSYHTELYQPHHQSEVDHYGSRGGSYDLEKKNMASNGLKLTLWKKEDKYVNENEKKSVMWMSSKMRLMKKMKSSDREDMEVSTNCSSYNSSNNIPTRVCSDCNTTKTPLWRSGPKGPKSLCNACGIRQRKARRAMAAAAGTTANGTTLATETSSALKIKVHPKEKITKVDTNNHVKPYKKRCKFVTATTGSSSSNNSQKFEDFFVNLSKNLAFQRVFPQDEKEAAILLMAISSGLVHG